MCALFNFFFQIRVVAIDVLFDFFFQGFIMAFVRINIIVHPISLAFLV